MTSWRRWNLLELSFLIALCGKWYFLFGYIPDTRTTTAPLWAVFTRDLFLFSFLTIAFWKFRSELWGPRQKIFSDRFLKVFSAVFIFGFLIGLLHLANAKSFETFGQHYLRNVLFPSLTVLLAAPIFMRGENFDFRKVIGTFALINVVISLLQIFFWPQMMWVTRPTGMLGDPLLCSGFLLLACPFLPFKNWRQSGFSLGVLALGAYVLFAASSLSAVLSWFAASILVVALSFRGLQLRNWRNLLKPLLIAGISLFILGTLLSSDALTDRLSPNHRIDQKTAALLSSFFCDEDECENQHWSVKGRLISNRQGLEFCQDNPAFCTVGDLKSPHYYRVDSTWSSLTLNWGFVFMLAYHLLFFVWPLKQIFTLRTWSTELRFSALVFFFYWIFSLMNAVFYKYPINILFYICVAHILFHQRKKTDSTRNP